MLYDGKTKPQIGAMMCLWGRSKPWNWNWNNYRLYAAYVSSPSELGFVDDWRANDVRLNHTWLMAVMGDSGASGTGDTTSSFFLQGTGDEMFYANNLQYKGQPTSSNAILLEYTPQFKARIGHDAGNNISDITNATCKTQKVLVYKCDYCSATKTEVDENSAYGTHANIVIIEEVYPTCDKEGYIVYSCMDCDTTVEIKKTAALGHVDKEGDGKCDANGCGANLEGSEGQNGCGCVCHKQSWLMKIIYKILKFFWKLLGIGKSCGCGTVHY